MSSAAHMAGAPELLSVQGLSKDYALRQGLLRPNQIISGIRDIWLSLATGTTTAIVGRSGAGKSTLARCIAGLEEPTAGEIWIRGMRVEAVTRRCRNTLAPVQLILQDSASALNPRFTASEIVAEPLLLQQVSRIDAGARVSKLMDAVGLAAEYASRQPYQLSGGERQRLAIARALALRPSLLILDEGFSGLDFGVQHRVLALLRELQLRFALTYLLISHDLRLMTEIASEIAIMHRGSILEQGATRAIVSAPRHQQTRALIQSVPGPALLEGKS
jgi:ABC-type glutathione transport system ATPase component